MLDARQANAVGAISSDELSAAIDRQRAATLASIAALKRRNAQPGSGNASGASSFQTTNIAAQFQDIAVTSAMGMSPIQIALQQGTQLAAVLGPMGATGVVKGLGEAFASIISPVSLVTIGVVAAAAAGAQWLFSLRGDVKTADEALKEHESIIDDIKGRWSGASGALDAYNLKSASLLASQARQDVTEQQRQLKAATDAFLNNTAGVKLAPDAVFHLPSGEEVDYLVRKSFEPFSDAIKTLRAQAKAGVPDIEQFQAAIDKKVSSDPGLTVLGDQLKLASEDAEELARKLGQAGVAAEIAGRQYSAAALSGFGNFLTGSFDSIDASKSTQRQALDLAAINARSPAQLAEIARKQKLLDLDGQGLTLARMQQEADQAAALAYARANHGIVDASMARLRSANDNIASAQLDVALIGKSIEETERLRFVRQQLAAAELEAAQTGTIVTETYRAKIEAWGATYGKVQQQLAISKMAGDLQFSRDQLGRSPIDAQVADQLRPIFGDDQTSGQAQFLAQQIRVNQSLIDLKSITADMTNGALQDLKNDLLSSAGLFKTLGDVGANALIKIGDNLLSIGGNATASGISGWLGNLLGLAGGGSASTAWGWSGLIPHNASGTDNFGGGLTHINEQGGEIVGLPSGSKIIPHDVSMEMARNGGGGGFVFAPSTTIDARGSTVTEAQIGALLDARDAAWSEKLPHAISYYQSNPRRRA